MAVYHYRVLRPNEPHRQLILEVSDLRSIEFDLLSIGEYCDVFINIVETFFPRGWALSEPNDVSQLAFRSLQPIAEAAIIKYARTIKSGVRIKMPSDVITDLSSEDKKWHAFFESLRDKHIAHSVSAIETYYTRIYFDAADPSNTDRWSIGYGAEPIELLSPEWIKQLKQLATNVKASLGRHIKIKSDTLLTKIRDCNLDEITTEEEVRNWSVPAEELIAKKRGR